MWNLWACIEAYYMWTWCAPHTQERLVCEGQKLVGEKPHLGFHQRILAEFWFSVDLSSTICIYETKGWSPRNPRNIWEWVVITIHPAQDSLYGKRDGALTGIAVTHQERSNIYKKTPLWRQGVVSDVHMLERAAMFKPEVQHVTLGKRWVTWNVYQNLSAQAIKGGLCFQNSSHHPPAAEPAVLQVLIQGKANMPHLGRALTDVQELKQATRLLA